MMYTYIVYTWTHKARTPQYGNVPTLFLLVGTYVSFLGRTLNTPSECSNRIRIGTLRGSVLLVLPLVLLSRPSVAFSSAGRRPLRSSDMIILPVRTCTHWRKWEYECRSGIGFDLGNSRLLEWERDLTQIRTAAQHCTHDRRVRHTRVTG